MTFQRVASDGELADGDLRSVELPDGRKICLAKVDGAVYAFDDRCTHAEYPLSEGSLEDDCRLECALHGAVFDIRDGTVLEAPAEETLQTYQVKVEDGGVWVGEPTGGS